MQRSGNPLLYRTHRNHVKYESLFWEQIPVYYLEIGRIATLNTKQWLREEWISTPVAHTFREYEKRARLIYKL